MTLKENCFNVFKSTIESINLPNKFTFPFYYEPHPLSVIAMQELQTHLKTQSQWQHNFGLTGNTNNAIGKMFGVLIVRNQQGQLGYLSAYSGKVANSNHLAHFVPPVFDMLVEDNFFMQGQEQLNALTKKIKHLDGDPQTAILVTTIQSEIASSMQEVKQKKAQIVEARKTRKAQRVEAKKNCSPKQAEKLNKQLADESIKQKIQLKQLQAYWAKRVQKAQQNVNTYTKKLTLLIKQRKNLSASLQQQIFEQYRFLNARGQYKSLFAIFKNTVQKKPPAAAGECAAPKLLHYAYKWGMRPIAMAEFWWGESPKSSIRKHKNVYPACLGKCQPILEHMLDGMEVDDNPLLNNHENSLSIDIIYEDADMLVINKPCFLLSVPGKNIQDSVYTRIKHSHPKATGPLLVHRIDMATSGLLLVALNNEAHKKLQKQFINRTIKKRYIALLDGLVKQDEGIINLPMSGDFYDRPRQIVDLENGKRAKTQYKVIERKAGKTKIYFYPVTGRTHQLRVHSAHISGLNAPIVGDTLYGQRAKRLHLHAEKIEFSHPTTGELMRFSTQAGF